MNHERNNMVNTKYHRRANHQSNNRYTTTNAEPKKHTIEQRGTNHQHNQRHELATPEPQAFLLDELHLDGHRNGSALTIPIFGRFDMAAKVVQGMLVPWS